MRVVGVRTRQAMVVGLVGLAGLVAGCSGPARGPHLEMSGRPLDLGKGEPGTEVKGTLALRNAGGSPLEYEIDASCGCTHLSPSRGVIAAGHLAEIEVGVKLDGEGSRRAVTLTIHTNDPEHPDVVAKVVAECAAVLAITPNPLNFGRVPAGAERRLSFRADLVEGAPVAIRPAGLRAVAHDPSLVVERSEWDRRGASFTVLVRASAPLGFLKTNVEVPIAETGRSVMVPVVAEVQGEVSVTPSVVSLRADPRAGAAREATFVVRRTDGERLGPLEKVSAPTGLRVEELGAGQGGAGRLFRRFRVWCPGSGVRKDAESVVLVFRGLTVPATVRVQPL